MGRVYTFTHDESGLSFTCDRTDGGLAQWTRGTYRYADRCVFRFPENAPTGAYEVSVAILAADGTPLPAFGPDGAPLPDGQLPVGLVTLQ